MPSLEDAILRTILYADVFNFPLRLEEIHHFLIADTPTSLHRVEEALTRSRRLSKSIVCVDGYFMRAGREELVALRRARTAASDTLWAEALRYGRWMSRLPFVRMVALTGALAMRNAVDNDDIDYLIVTSERRVWLARAASIVLVRLARLRGIHLCPNYVLAETALCQEKRDLFMAHEITQMIPLFGWTLYERMRQENDWVERLLPNANGVFSPSDERALGRGWLAFKRGLELALRGAVGDALEDWERRRKVARFAPQMQSQHSAAHLDAQRVKGHFNDHGHPALMHYYERLAAYGVTDDSQ
jgi:hypothetical protein